MAATSLASSVKRSLSRWLEASGRHHTPDDPTTRAVSLSFLLKATDDWMVTLRVWLRRHHLTTGLCSRRLLRPFTGTKRSRRRFGNFAVRYRPDGSCWTMIFHTSVPLSDLASCACRPLPTLVVSNNPRVSSRSCIDVERISLIDARCLARWRRDTYPPLPPSEFWG